MRNCAINDKGTSCLFPVFFVSFNNSHVTSRHGAVPVVTVTLPKVFSLPVSLVFCLLLLFFPIVLLCVIHVGAWYVFLQFPQLFALLFFVCPSQLWFLSLLSSAPVITSTLPSHSLTLLLHLVSHTCRSSTY